MARETQHGVAHVLGAIGMREEGTFEQGGSLMHLFASERQVR